MKEFEQQVLSELLLIAHRGTVRPLEWAEAIEFIAPHVARAIRAASPTTASYHEEWGLQKALAVLQERPVG